jgi:hypothetical protein
MVRRIRRPQKGVMLLAVVLLMSVVTGLLSVLALNSAQLYRQRRLDRVHSVARALADSGAAYARARLRAVPATLPGAPIELEVKELLPVPMTGSLVLAFPESPDHRVCHVTARAALGNREAEEEIDVDMPPSTATRPASSKAGP